MVFKPGDPAINRAGRPKGIPTKPKAIVPPKTAKERMCDAILLAREASPEGVRTLQWLMRNGDTHAVRLNAANSLLDRGLGKPTQPIGVWMTKSLNEMSIAELEELEMKLVGEAASLAIEPPKPIIDAEPMPQPDTATEEQQ